MRINSHFNLGGGSDGTEVRCYARRPARVTTDFGAIGTSSKVEVRVYAHPALKRALRFAAFPYAPASGPGRRASADTTRGGGGTRRRRGRSGRGRLATRAGGG